MRETVQVTRRVASGTDRYNNPTFTESTIEILAAVATTSRSTDYQPDQENVNEGLTLYLPPETVISDSDVITVRGLEYVLDGETFEWLSPFSSWTPGVIINLKRRGQTIGS